MSTLKVTNIAGLTGSSTDVVEGLAKAWLHYDQSANSTRDSFNISSVTDTTTGNFDPQINNNMANSNYAIQHSGAPSNQSNSQHWGTTVSAPSTGAFDVKTPEAGTTGAGLEDWPENYCMINGDLA